STGFRTDNSAIPQPGTVGFVGGPVCTSADFGGPVDSTIRLPGCRGPGPDGIAFTADDDPGYDPTVDGTTTGLVHPFTGDPWQNELAALSWNFMMFSLGNDDDFDAADPMNPTQCSFVTPQFCSITIPGLLRLAGVQRNIERAGGNGRFGRRTFQWHSGGEVVVRFEKRNVLGLSMDFAEDVTKSSFSFEFTWIEGLPAFDNDEFDGLSQVHEFNLTVSADRPTFINFLNPNRTFFFNSQWFVQYRSSYQKGFPSNGPWNLLGTFAISTGYFQDRLLPSLVFVFDVRSRSGAALPEITYRFSENFSTSFGLAMFMGRSQLVNMPVNEIGSAGNRQGKHAYQDSAQNGLAVVRDRDEVFFRVRYTF
ncbi:MAG: hypothetical protein V3T33_05700, partial [Myxococcota bacterium]